MDVACFVRYIIGETCEKGSGFLTVLQMNVVSDLDTTGIVRGYLMNDKQSGTGLQVCKGIVRKKM